MISNLISSKGNAVANQFVIKNKDGIFFKSYNSVVAQYYKGKLVLGKDWNYSNTTKKYLYQFIRENTHYDTLSTLKELKSLINNGKVTELSTNVPM